uniref:HORMA domain-containing protein n=1 Tax=Cyclophora tenuis TaxID=216820 RepID=A0A7S1D6Q8_CYCTE|mmetsp:Transcript_25091/g.42749  ORF Transcript_25091/g.42749 Transcript_25091/m.42749 type:complete len:224 (+) Transcript_25091:118-789(+)
MPTATEALLLAALEAVCHEILHVRRLYPLDSFTGATVLGGCSIHVSRHPRVVEYIAETMEMVVQAMLAGMANQISITLRNNRVKDNPIISETYTLQFGNNLPDLCKGGSNHEQQKLLADMERCWRNILLSIIGLGGTKDTTRQPWGEDATFQISFQTELPLLSSEKSTLLQQQLSSKSWCATDESETNQEQHVELQKNPQRRYRPIHRGTVGDLLIEFAMILE